VDEYARLRAKDDPNTLAGLKAETEYTEAATAHLAGPPATVFTEINSRTQETEPAADLLVGHTPEPPANDSAVLGGGAVLPDGHRGHQAPLHDLAGQGGVERQQPPTLDQVIAAGQHLLTCWARRTSV
jgi:hypothetical protein